MFGVDQRIRQIYYEMKGKKPFLYPFNLKVRITIRTGTDVSKLDSDRILKELNYIAEACKQRNLNAGQYLSIVARYVDDIKEGHHKKMHLHPDSLEMKYNCKEFDASWILILFLRLWL